MRKVGNVIRYLVFFLIPLAPPGVLQAQEQDAPEVEIPDDVADEARRLLAEAGAHHDARRFGLAAEGYMEMYEVLREANVPRAAIALWNAGLALMEIPGRATDARDTFQRFLDESSVLTHDAQVRDWRSAAVQRIAELDTRIRADESEPDAAAGPEPVEVDEGASEPEAPEPVTTISPIGPIVLGAGVLTLGVGAVFGALALTGESDLANRCGGTRCVDTPEHRAAYDELRTFAAAADVLLVVGGLAAITGAILTFTLSESSTETTASAGLRPGGAEVAISGRF